MWFAEYKPLMMLLRKKKLWSISSRFGKYYILYRYTTPAIKVPVKSCCNIVQSAYPSGMYLQGQETVNPGLALSTDPSKGERQAF